MLQGESRYVKTNDDMSTDTQAIRSYFFKLGLSLEIADVYLALCAYGEQSLSELSRRSGVERTRLYRLMDELEVSNLVEIETRYKRKVVRAAPISNLQILLSKKEQELHELYLGLGDLQNKIKENTARSEATKVQAYRGIEGLKQMFWNQTHGKTENLSILYQNMQVQTKLTFFERWVRVMNERQIKARTVMSSNFMKTQQEWYDTHANERLADWHGRYVPDEVFPITHSTVIYDDITSYYNWKDGELFGVEIYNQEIADAQRHFFEMLWLQGLALDDLRDLSEQLPVKK